MQFRKRLRSNEKKTVREKTQDCRLLFEKRRLITLTLDQSENRNHRSSSTPYRNKRTSCEKDIKKTECRITVILRLTAYSIYSLMQDARFTILDMLSPVVPNLLRDRDRNIWSTDYNQYNKLPINANQSF